MGLCRSVQSSAMRSRSVFVSVFSDTEASWWDVRERIKSFERLFEMNDMIRFTVGSRSFLMNSGGKSTTFLYLGKHQHCNQVWNVLNVLE